MGGPADWHTDSQISEAAKNSTPSVVLLGVSFRTASIDIRERIAKRLSNIREEGTGFDGQGVLESSVVETCNRLEIYLASNEPDESVRSAIRKLDGGASTPESFYVKSGLDAIRHVFRVAAGLDSPVLGEDQILQQVWEAGRTARISGQAKSILSSLFDAAYSSGKRIRESYRVSSYNESLSAFALRHALRELGHKPSGVLLIGSGEAARLAALRLKGSTVYLLSGRKGTKATFPNVLRIPRRNLRQVSAKCDLIIAATRHSGYVLTKRDLPRVRKTVILDLGFPRNVDPAIKNSRRILLYDLDDVASWASSAKRYKLSSADGIVEAEAERFNAWLTASRLTPTLATIYRWAERIRVEETESALRRLQGLSPREKTVVEAMTRRLTGKLMAPHATFAKGVGNGGDQDERLHLLESIFKEGDR